MRTSHASQAVSRSARPPAQAVPARLLVAYINATVVVVAGAVETGGLASTASIRLLAKT